MVQICAAVQAVILWRLAYIQLCSFTKQVQCAGAHHRKQLQSLVCCAAPHPAHIAETHDTPVQGQLLIRITSTVSSTAGRAPACPATSLPKKSQALAVFMAIARHPHLGSTSHGRILEGAHRSEV